MTAMMTEQLPWGMIHDGMMDLSLIATAVGMGASLVRVGFEDSTCYAPGKTATFNVELVDRLVSLIRQMGYETATPVEARNIPRITQL